MNFSFTTEQEELRRYTRQWLDENCPLETVRMLMDTERGYDDGHWAAIAEMGWLGMAIPTEWGGAGFTFLELFVLLEEQGRSLFCAPFLSTVVMAAGVVEEAGDDRQKKEILSAIALGELIAAVAFTEPNGRWEAEGVTTEGPTPAGGRLDIERNEELRAGWACRRSVSGGSRRRSGSLAVSGPRRDGRRCPRSA